jgi:hypothetical protein
MQTDRTNEVFDFSSGGYQVSYDRRYGYPLRVYVDPSAQIADEEYGYETSIVK